MFRNQNHQNHHPSQTYCALPCVLHDNTPGLSINKPPHPTFPGQICVMSCPPNPPKEEFGPAQPTQYSNGFQPLALRSVMQRISIQIIAPPRIPCPTLCCMMNPQKPTPPQPQHQQHYLHPKQRHIQAPTLFALPKWWPWPFTTMGGCQGRHSLWTT